MNKSETIERATRVLAMIHVLQSEIDELAREKAFFRHGLKMTGNNFQKELEAQIRELYKHLTPEAEQFYYDQVRCLEELHKAYFQNKIEVINDNQK